MNLQFLQSWRGALLIAGIVTLGMAGYKAAFGPDPATRIAQARTDRLLPGGQPPEALLNRQLVAGRPFVGTSITLAQFAQLFRQSKLTVTWEALGPESFIMRAKGQNTLTRQPVEVAAQFILLSGPVQNGRQIGVFEGPAIGITGIAYDREALTQDEIAQVLISMMTGRAFAPRR